MGKQNIHRKPGTTDVEFDEVSTVTTGSAEIQAEISSLDNAIASLEARKALLEADLAIIQAAEPVNINAVEFAIVQIDAGQTKQQIVADLQAAPYNLSTPDANIAHVDAAAIIAER